MNDYLYPVQQLAEKGKNVRQKSEFDRRELTRLDKTIKELSMKIRLLDVESQKEAGMQAQVTARDKVWTAKRVAARQSARALEVITRDPFGFCAKVQSTSARRIVSGRSWDSRLVILAIHFFLRCGLSFRVRAMTTLSLSFLASPMHVLFESSPFSSQCWQIWSVFMGVACMSCSPWERLLFCYFTVVVTIEALFNICLLGREALSVSGTPIKYFFRSVQSLPSSLPIYTLMFHSLSL